MKQLRFLILALLAADVSDSALVRQTGWQRLPPQP